MDRDFVGFTDEFGERRRRAEIVSSPLLRALGLVVREVGAEPGAAIATAHATSDLIADTLADLGRAEEKLRAQNEALFAARTELEHDQQVFRDLFDLAPTASLVTTRDGRIVRVETWPVRLTPKHGDPIECGVRTRVRRVVCGVFPTPADPVLH